MSISPHVGLFRTSILVSYSTHAKRGLTKFTCRGLIAQGVPHSDTRSFEHVDQFFLVTDGDQMNPVAQIEVIPRQPGCEFDARDAGILRFPEELKKLVRNENPRDL